MRTTRFSLGLLILLLVGFFPASAQERGLTGSLSAGWSYSQAKETFKEVRKDPFTTLKLDFQNYLFDPLFLTYRIRPRFSTGFENIFTASRRVRGLKLLPRSFRNGPGRLLSTLPNFGVWR